MIPQKPLPNQPKPKKSLGQNFLIDQASLNAISDAVEIKNTDIIVEIGPGHGELTEKLLERKPKKLIAIEKDRELAKNLDKTLAKTHKNLQIIEGDALDLIGNWKLEIGNSDKYKLVGNIPYYITGYLLRIIGELANKPELIVFTTQKEVAQRVSAQPRNMNLLSASVQFWGKTEMLGIISRNAFLPVPKVDSAVIRIVPSKQLLANSEAYYKTLKILFKQPRKTILNNLKDAVKRKEISAKLLYELAEKFPELVSGRPQDVSVEELKQLALYFD